MDDDDDDAVFEEKPCVSRLSRKVGEKLRRDRLNSLITQLAEEIPIIKYAHRRLDKSAILRLTVSFMKLQLGLKRKKLGHNVSCQPNAMLNWLKQVLEERNDILSNLCLGTNHMTDDTLLIVTETGTIVYVSPKIFDILGFYQTDMVGYNVKRFVHRDDVNMFMSQFHAPTDASLQSAFSTCPQDTISTKSDDSQTVNSALDSSCVRMMRASGRKQNVDSVREYETICIKAHCDKTMVLEDNQNSAVHERWMVALLKPFSAEPLREVEVKISEFMKNNEWATLHDLDGRIIGNEHRASLFHGYMYSEVMGKTPYMFIGEEDLEHVAISHQMIMKNHEIPLTVFRLKNMLGLLIYVKSQSILVNDQWTKKPKYICSVNTVLSLDEGKYLLEAQIKKTQAFVRSQQTQEVKSEKADIQEVEKMDCVQNLDQNFLSNEKLQQIRKTSGKSLNEIYDKYSENFPSLYIPEDRCSSANKSVFAEKRSYDYMDSDSNGFESLNSTNTGSETSSLSVTEDEADSPKYRSPSIKDLLLDDKNLEYPLSGNNKSEQANPILKSILKGNKNKEKICTKIEKSVRNKRRSFSERANEKGASVAASLSTQSSECQGHAAAGHIAGVQSPTVDSSGPACSSADGSTDVKMMPSVHNRFTGQLATKHAMLKQTMDSQKITLEILRNQLQKSLNNVILNPKQKQVHDSLIEKITEAENQVVVQGQLLGELEHEIVKQHN